MKYKTLFRILLKGIGVFLFALSMPQFLSPIYMMARSSGIGWTDITLNLIAPAVQTALACYLFFGGKWIADLAIPGNRPYCHECGYDLSGAAGSICNECGTPFRAPARASEQSGENTS